MRVRTVGCQVFLFKSCWSFIIQRFMWMSLIIVFDVFRNLFFKCPD